MSSTNKSLVAAAEVLEIVADELTYLPSPEQRKTKSAFWARFNDNPLCEPEDISLALATRLGGDGRLSKWWSQIGFREWFRNRDEFRQRMEYLSNLALDRLELLLADPKANPSAQVNAAKLIMEVARKTPSKQTVERYLDEKIAEMNRDQLEAYINRHLGKLPPSQEQLQSPLDTAESV